MPTLPNGVLNGFINVQARTSGPFTSSSHSTTQDDPCFTCKIVREYVDLANSFTQDLSEALMGPMWALFLAIVGVWVIIQGLRMSIGQTTIIDFTKELVFVLIASLLLSGQGPDLINEIYSASLKIMGAAATVALQVGDNTASNVASYKTIGGGMESLVRTAEEGVFEVFGMAEEIAAKARLTDPMPILYSLVLVFPYFLVLIVYFSQVVISIFRVMMLATLSPYLMLGFGFGWGRDMAKAGVRTLLSSFMVLFGATAALAVMLYAVRGLDIGNAQDPMGDISITNIKYLVAVAMGWLGTAFMTEATGMANSISNSSLTNTSAAVITAGAATSVMTLAGGGKNLGILGARRGWQAATGGPDYAKYGAAQGAEIADRVAALSKKVKQNE